MLNHHPLPVQLPDAGTYFNVPILEEGFDPAEEEVLGDELHSLHMDHPEVEAEELYL